MSQSTPIDETIIEQAANIVFKTAISVLNAVGKKTKDTVGIQMASRKYLQNYTGRHGQIKVLGMSKPVPIRDVYTAVQFIQPTYWHDLISSDEMDKTFRESGTRSLWPAGQKKSDGMRVANSEQYLTVLGSPGSGKTTFLKRVGLEALLGHHSMLAAVFSGHQEQYKHNCLPIFIELKTLHDSMTRVSDLIHNEFTTCGFPDAFCTAALAQGKVLILLDGLDEVAPGLLRNTIMEIRNLVDTHSKNRFIISCRTASYKTWFSRFTDVHLSDFDDKQIDSFIVNWFRSWNPDDEDSANELRLHLKRAENAATADLCRTPLLLTFLCLVYYKTQRIPPNRSLLYKRSLDILLEEWSAEKLLHRQDANVTLFPELEIQLLSQFAGPAFAANRLFFQRHTLLATIHTITKDELAAPPSVEAHHILKEIEEEQGLLVQRAPDVYSFSHLTVQEYLTAHYYYSTGRVAALIKDALFSRWWRDVFLLLAGFCQADEMLHQMADEVSGYLLKHDKVRNLIMWAGSSVE